MTQTVDSELKAPHSKKPTKNTVKSTNVQRTTATQDRNASWTSESQENSSEKIEISRAAEERRRTGRYLAVCLTFVMIFVACYHILMRQMPVLVGLLAPAIIMILYVLWLLYFAKKRRQTQATLV